MRVMSRVGGLSDQELWQRVRAGDSAAFGDLFDRHSTAVYNHVFRRTANWTEAEDLTSAVFLQAWRSHRKVAIDRESVLPWSASHWPPNPSAITRRLSPPPSTTSAGWLSCSRQYASCRATSAK
jgi:hypothetical protein